MAKINLLPNHCKMNITVRTEVPGIQLAIKSYPSAGWQQTMPVKTKEEILNMVILHKVEGNHERK